MKKNVGRVDKGFRLIAGLAILAVGYANQSYWGLLGFVPLLTAAISFCPLYTILKIQTCPKNKTDLDVMS